MKTRTTRIIGVLICLGLVGLTACGHRLANVSPVPETSSGALARDSSNAEPEDESRLLLRLLDVMADPALVAATPTTLPAKLSSFIQFTRRNETPGALSLVGSNVTSGIEWAIADFQRSAPGAQPEWSLLQIQIAIGSGKSALGQRRDAFEVEISKRLGAPHYSDKSEALAAWKTGIATELILSIARAPNPFAGPSTYSRTILLEFAVPQGEPE